LAIALTVTLAFNLVLSGGLLLSNMLDCAYEIKLTPNPLVHMNQYTTYAILQIHYIFKALITVGNGSTLAGLSAYSMYDWHMHLHSEGSGKPHPSAVIASLLAMADSFQPHSHALFPL
jgi:hypothetical protein